MPLNDQTFKEKWIAALESGEFKQGQTFLWNVEGKGDINYCCLGVACEILGYEKGPSAIFVTPEGEHIAGYPGAGWQGLTMQEIRRLYIANDRDRKSLKEIAQIIRTEL